MITKLILTASMIWLIPLMYYMNVNETKFKKNIVIGVTLPYEAREDTDVQLCLARFKKEERITCLLLFLLAFTVFLVQDFTAYFTIWLIWIDLVCIVPQIPYVLCNGRLKKIKQDPGNTLLPKGKPGFCMFRHINYIYIRHAICADQQLMGINNFLIIQKICFIILAFNRVDQHF